MIIKPKINNSYLTRKKIGFDENLKKKLINYRRKTYYLIFNEQEIVTMMTINDYPEYLAIGYLLNQNMISKKQKFRAIDYEADLSVVVVRTSKKPIMKQKLKKNCNFRLYTRNTIRRCDGKIQSS